MKYALLITTLLVSTSCAPINTNKSGFENWPFTREWKDEHWKGQDFKPSIQPESSIMKLSVDISTSMFAQGTSVSPGEFIDNLKKANIIKRVYNPEYGGFWNRKTSADVVIELGPNFYTLSYADQSVITDMISRAYQRNDYTLQDGITKKIVGQITPDGFVLF